MTFDLDSIDPNGLLPRPFLPKRADLLRLYSAAWCIARSRAIRPPAPWRPDGQPFVDACFNANLFQWDSCLIAQWLRYEQGAFADVLPQPLSLLDNFYAAQHDDGAIAREIDPDGRAVQNKHMAEDTKATDPWRLSSAFTNPPLFAWAEWDHAIHTGDDSRLARVLPVLAGYFDWYATNRSRPNGMLWWDSFGSGMDNLPRPGAWGWVDYTAFAALECEHLANIALHAGDQAIASSAAANYLGFKELVQTQMWDAYLNRFGDVDEDGYVSGSFHLGCFWPLLANLALPEQVDTMIGHLTNLRHFWRTHPLATLAGSDKQYRRSGGYWRGAVWAPTNYLAMRALLRAGRRDVARDLMMTHLGVMAQVLDKTGTIWENYAPEGAAPGDDARRDFCGWSALTPIAGLIEGVLGLHVDGMMASVEWDLSLDEEHGIAGLKVGPAWVNLRAVPAEGGWRVEASARGSDVELRIKTTTAGRSITLAPGRPFSGLVR